MMRKLVQGTALSAAVAILPALGNPPALRAPQLWMLLTIGILAMLWQPCVTFTDAEAPSKDQGTATHILSAVIITQLAAVTEALYLRFPQSLQWDLAAHVALGCMITGLLLRSWAVWTLGPYFTWHITTQAGHTLIRRGPYRFVRHPGYAGALLIYGASPVLLHAWGAAILSWVALPLAFLRRIHHEEAALTMRLGERYTAYCQSVKRLIPRIY